MGLASFPILMDVSAEPFFAPVALPISALGFWSTARLSSYATSSPCLRVRRASDNAELDIFWANNQVDWASAAAFKGASSLTIVTMYDQSGNGYDLTQATAALQPSFDTSLRAVSGGKFSVTFDRSRVAPAVRKLLQNASIPITENSFEILMCVTPIVSHARSVFHLSPPAAQTISLKTQENTIGLWSVNNGVPFIGSASPPMTPPIKPCVIGQSGGAGGVGLVLNGVRRTNATVGTTLRTGIDVGANTAVAGNDVADGCYNLYSMVVFASELSAGNRTSVIAELGRTGGAQPDTETTKIVWIGDSRTEGWGSLTLKNIPSYVYSAVSPKPYMINNGIGGITTGTAVTNATTRITQMYDSSRSRNILVIPTFGINDFNNGVLAVTVQANMTSLITTARTAGYQKILVTSCLPRSGMVGAKETERQTWNSFLAGGGWSTIGADAFDDVAADPLIGTYSSTYYPDVVHLNDAGQLIAANRIIPTLQSWIV